MKTMLVGGSGFVGSNLLTQTDFDSVYNSKNIREAYGTQPDLLVYAGVRAEMFLANQNPEQDMAVISGAAENIRKIAPKRVVLISTTAVYRDTRGQTEDSVMPLEGLPPYGRNRYFLECWVRHNYPRHLILRLPALFGKNLKKNFIYDYIHVIPAMLKPEKYRELAEESKIIQEAYVLAENGYFCCREQDAAARKALKDEFKRVGFSALHFTDSRSVYQFYHLAHLWKHISLCLKEGIQMVNLATEPIQAGELYHFLSGGTFENPVSQAPYHYDMRSEYAALLGGTGGYLFSKEFVMKEIKEFVKGYEA